MGIRHLIFSLGIGGTERPAQNLAIGTAQLGHDTELIALQDGPRREAPISEGVQARVIAQDSALENTLSDAYALVIPSHGLDNNTVSDVMELSGRTNVGEINVFSEPTPQMDKLDVSFQLSPWAHVLSVKRGGGAQRSSTLPYPVEGSGFFKQAEYRRTFRDEDGFTQDALVIGRIGQRYEGNW